LLYTTSGTLQAAISFYVPLSNKKLATKFSQMSLETFFFPI